MSRFCRATHRGGITRNAAQAEGDAGHVRAMAAANAKTVMNRETTYRAALVTLLTAILIVQILILIRLPAQPVSAGELYGPAAQEKSSEERQALRWRLPLVRMEGEVEVKTGIWPLDVEIQGTPLEVQIVR